MLAKKGECLANLNVVDLSIAVAIPGRSPIRVLNQLNLA